MRVIKRDLREEPIKFDKVTSRIERLCYGLNMNVIDASEISQKVVSQIFDGITTSQIDELASQICFQLNTTHPDYGILATRIAISKTWTLGASGWGLAIGEIEVTVPLNTGPGKASRKINTG